MTDDTLTTETQDALLALVRRIAKLESLGDDDGGEDGLGFSSMELDDDSLSVFDEDGNERLNIGIQDDGRFAIKHKGGTPPPKPTAPDCDPVLAGVRVYYDGTFEDDEDVPSDLAYYEVHASPDPDFVADDTTMVGTMYSPDGGTFVYGIVTPHETWYFAIVAVDRADNHSEQSDGTACKSGGIQGMQDYATCIADGTHVRIPLTHKPIPHTTVHVKWNGGVLHRTEWEFSDDGWYVELTNDSWWKADDEFEAQYLYLDPGERPPLVASILVVSSGHAVDPTTEIVLEDAEAGDIFMLSIIAHDISPANCTDDRVVEGHADLINPGSPTMSAWHGYGVCDASGDPLPITCPSDARVMWVVFRVTGTITSVYTTIQTSASPHTPDPLPVAADMGIMAIAGVSHFVPSPFDNDATSQWTTVSPGLDSGGTVDASSLIAYCETGTPDGSWDGLDGDPRWVAFMLGLTGD